MPLSYGNKSSLAKSGMHCHIQIQTITSVIQGGHFAIKDNFAYLSITMQVVGHHEYPQVHNMFLWRIDKKYSSIITKHPL